MADVTRRGFLARLGAVVATVGVGARIGKTESIKSKCFIKEDAVGTTDPAIDYNPDFISSKILPSTTTQHWRAGKSICSGQLVSLRNNTLYPAQKYGNITGVALSDGRRGATIPVIDYGIMKVKL